jgi:demethylmenaquinone methyltransferase / 2-methoxy-6-polyprenyl-1,4-benzoquinol methylase
LAHLFWFPNPGNQGKLRAMTEKDRDRVARMFDQLAPVYDLGNHLLSFGLDFLWRKRLASELKKFAPLAVLDLACGTMDLAIAIKKQNPGATVTGIDLAGQMLKLGAEKVRAKGLESEILSARADIERMPFADESFDAASIAFGIRNVEHREAALLEIRRVLKPGGVFCVLEFTLPKNGMFAALYRLYLGTMLPLIGKILSGGKSYFYLRDTIAEFPGPDGFQKELEATGFSVVRSIGLSGGAVYIHLAQRAR